MLQQCLPAPPAHTKRSDGPRSCALRPLSSFAQTAPTQDGQGTEVRPVRNSAAERCRGAEPWRGFGALPVLGNNRSHPCDEVHHVREAVQARTATSRQESGPARNPAADVSCLCRTSSRLPGCDVSQLPDRAKPGWRRTDAERDMHKRFTGHSDFVEQVGTPHIHTGGQEASATSGQRQQACRTWFWLSCSPRLLWPSQTEDAVLNTEQQMKEAKDAMDEGAQPHSALAWQSACLATCWDPAGWQRGSGGTCATRA